MSFLCRAQPALRVIARPSSRLFTSTAIQSKSATEAVKDTVKGVDRKVSDAAVSGIEKGRKLHFLTFSIPPLFKLKFDRHPYYLALTTACPPILLQTIRYPTSASLCIPASDALANIFLVTRTSCS